MTRRLKSPLALAALAIAGILVFAFGAAAVKPADAAPEPAAQVTNAAAAPTTTSAPVESTDSSIPPTIPTTIIAPPPTIPIEEALADVVASAPPPHRPERVYIGSIGVDATIIDLGLNPDRTLEVPEDIRLTGWWTGRSVPGEEGPSIVVGHVDSAAAGPGVFWRLRELDIGDVIHIERSDGSISEFRVIETELVLKDEFPTEKVYGSTEGSQLRLITCGGSFDQSTRSYLGNVIVYAEHVGTTQLPPPPSLGSAV
jgi:sortase (surface protein transpeptidase)